jgi:hypothetical protein
MADSKNDLKVIMVLLRTNFTDILADGNTND